MKYGMMRWMVMIVAAAGLTLGGCSRQSETAAVPLDQFVRNPGSPDPDAGGSAVSIKLGATSTEIAQISNPQYQVLNGTVVPNRQTSLSVAMQGKFNLAATSSPQPLGTSATPVPNRVNRMLVFADRVPWGTTLDSNGTDNTVTCAFADTLVIDTGFTTDNAVDPDIAGLGRFEDGVSVCGETASANCLNLGVTVGGALTPTYDGVTGFINHAASGVRGNAQPTNGVIPANSNADTAATTGICEAVVPVRITASGSDRGWSTLTNYPVLLNGSDFWVTFRFEFFGGNSNATAPLLATTLPAPACVGGCFDPSLTLQANVTGVNDFPFTFDALPPHINASSYTRASNTITLATGGGGDVTVGADVASSITINGTTFNVVEVGGVIADPLTDFEYIDADGDTAVNDTDVNAQGFVDLINRHPVLGGVIAHQVGGVITVTATERGTAGNAVNLATADANEVTYVIGGGGTNLEGGTDGPATVGPLVTGGIPRQLPYGPIGYLQNFDDLSTTSGLPVVTAGSQNFVSRNVQGNDLITFLSDGNNGRTRVIAGVSVEKSVEADVGSSATVIVDADTLLSSMPSDGILVGGTVTGQTGTAANVGVTRTIVASDTTLGTLTVSPAFPAAVAAGDTLLIRQGGAAVSPSLLGLTASVPADSSAAQYLIAHADVQALRPRETGGNVVIEDVRFASANSAVVTGTIEEGRPAVIIFTGADSIPFNLNDDLAFVTAQSGAASNRIRIQFTDTGTLGVTIAEWPANYIGGPDAPAAGDDNDLIININYDAGTTTQLAVAAAVASHPVARRFVQAIPFGGLAAVTAAVDGLINPPPPGSLPLNPATEGALIPGIGSDIAQITVRGVNQVTGAIQTRSAVITRSQSAIDPTLATAVYEDIDGTGVPVANTAIRFYARTAGAAANGVEIDIQDGVALDVTADDGVNLTIEAPAGTTADEIVEFVNEGSRGSRQVNSADGAGGRNDILFENVLSGSDAATGYAVSTQILDGATPGVTVTQVGVNPVNVTVIINRGTGGTTLRAAEVVSLVNTHPVAQLFVRASLAAGPTTLVEPVAAVGANPRTTFDATTLNNTLNQFYTAGTVTFTTGANAGETRQIISYTAATRTIVVSPGFTNDISVADQFTLVNTNDGQRLFEPANDGVPVAMAGQSGRSAFFKAMHDAGSTGTGAYDLTAGALGPVFTFGGSDPSALLGFVGRIKSSNANIVVGQYSGGECNPSFTDLVMSGHSSLCFTATIPIAEGGTVFDIQATDGSGNLTSDIAQTALLGNPLACSAIVPGDTTPDRCEIVDGAATANLQVVRDVTPPILIADSQDPAYDTTRYEAAASIDCTAPPPGNFCSRPVFVLPADAPAGGGSFTSFSPTVSVGGHVIDYTSTTTAFDTEAAGRTLVRVQSDNNYDSFASPGAGSLDEHGNPVPYTDGDAGVDNGFFRYGNISLRTGALTNFTVTAWDQAGNTTSFSFSVRQFEGNINTPPHFAIDCVVEDTPALVTSATADGNTPPRAIMCENDANSSNPNTPIVVRSLDMNNSANPGGRFGDFVGEQGPTVTTGLVSGAGTGAGAVEGPASVSISTASDFFHVGDLITFTDGLAVGQTRTVTAYNAGTSTFTVTPAFSPAPAPGDIFTLASFGHYDAATGTATMVDTLDALSTVPTNPVDVDTGAVAGLSTVDDAYVGGTLTVEDAGATGTCAVGLVLTVTDYVAATGLFSVTTTAAACDLDTDAQLVLRHGDGRNYRSVGALDTLGAGVMPQLDFRTVRSDRIFLQGRTLSLDALPPTVYLGADPTIVKVSGDLMPADGNGTGNPARDFLTLAVAGGNGSSVISIADDVFVTDNLRPGDFISLSSLQGSQSPNVGLFRITACEALDVTGTFCEGLAPFDLTLDKPLPADALGMFVQSAYVWSAPSLSVPVEGINSYLFIAIDSVLSDPNDPLSGNQTVVPFAVIRDTLPPAIVIQGVVNNQDSVAANPIVFMTDQTLFLGSSSTLPAQHRSFIAVTRLDNNGEDEDNVTAHQRGDYRIFADRLTGNSENTAGAAQSLLATQTSLGQAQAALLTGDVPARPLDVDLSCGDNHADGDDQCRPGQDMAYRVEVAANDRVGRSSVAAVQFNIVESAVDRLLSGALGIISSNPAVVSLISDPTELRTLTLDQLSNSGVLYNLNFHTSLLLGAPNDTVASNPRQAFYLDSRTDFAIVLGTLLQDVDGTGPSDSTVVILANVGRILLDNGVLDDLLPLLDDQAIINPRARENFPAGPRTDPGDATLSSIFLEEIMRDPAEAATPCNVGVNQYNCYDDPGTVKNTLPMVKNALDSKQSLRMRATDVTVADTNTLNARVSGIDLIINPVPVAGESVCDSATGGFLPVSNPGEEDSFINTQPGDYIEIVTGACAGGRARVTVVNSDTQIQTEPFRGVYTSTEDGGITATTLEDSTTIGHDPALYTGQTLRILSGVNVLQTATVTSFDDVTGEFTFAAGCVPGPCAVSGAGDAYTVNQLLSTACTSVGGCEGAGCAFRVVPPQGPSMEPIFDLADHLLFMDLDNDGRFGEREVISSLMHLIEESMANPQEDFNDPSYVGSYPTAADRYSLVCPATGICPNTLADIQDAPSLQGMMDLIYELSDNDNPADGVEFISRLLNLVRAAISEYPREATNPLAPRGATVLEAVSFITRDLLSDEIGSTGLMAEPLAAIPNPDYELLTSPDDRQNSRMNLLMRSTYIMGPNGVSLPNQTITLKNGATTTVNSVLTAVFPLLHAISDDPDDNPRGIPFPPFTFGVQQSVLEKLLPAIELVLRDNRLEDVIDRLADILDPGTNVSDLTAFDYVNNVRNTGFADQPPNPYTVNPPILRVITELGGATIDPNLDNDPAQFRTSLDYTTDALNVLLTRVGKSSPVQENVSADGTSVNTKACSEAYFAGRTPIEVLLNVVAQLVETAPKDPRHQNFRDNTCGSFNPGDNRQYVRVLIDGLFDDPNTQDFEANDIGPGGADDIDDYPGNPVGAYNCGGNRGPNGGDGIAVDQAALDILPEVINTALRFGYDSQDRINSIFAECDPAQGDTLTRKGGCYVNNGYPNGTDERLLSVSRLGIDLAMILDAPFAIGSGGGLIRFEQSVVREALEQIAVMSATDAVNYILLLTLKIAEDIQPINGTLTVPDPQDITRSTAAARALADPDGDGNPAPDGVIDDIIPVVQALGASGLAQQILDLLRAVRACGVDDAPGANGRDIKGGELLKSSEDLTLILLDAFSGARGASGNNDGTNRTLVTETPEGAGGVAYCPATPDVNGIGRGFTGGPLDQNPAREEAEALGADNATTTVRGDTALTTLSTTAGFYTGGLITFLDGPAAGETRRITNYALAAGTEYLFTFDALSAAPVAGNRYAVTLSSVNVGVLMAGNDLALTGSDDNAGDVGQAEARNWGAIYSEALPPSTTNFNAGGVGPGAFLCIETRGADQPGGYDEACAPLTARPGTTAPDLVATNDCAADGTLRNCVTFQNDVSAPFLTAYDNIQGYMALNCNQRRYAVTGGTDVTIVVGAGDGSLASIGVDAFAGQQLVFVTDSTDVSVSAGDVATITANTAGPGPITFTVTGLDVADDPTGGSVRLFGDQSCSYRVRQMREPYNGCVGGDVIGGEGLGLALSSFGGPTPLPVNPFRDSRMDLLLRTLDHLHRGVNAVDTGGGAEADYSFFDRAVGLITFVVQPNPDNENNRSMAENLIFGANGFEETEEGPVQRMLNDGPTRSALSAVTTLFARLTAATGVPTLDSVTETVTTGDGAAPFDTFVVTGINGTYPADTDLLGRAITFTSGANTGVTTYVTAYDPGTDTITVTGVPAAIGLDDFIVQGREDRYDRYPNFVDASGWPTPAGADCSNTGIPGCDGNAINDAVDYQLLALSGLLGTLGDRDGRDGELGANAVLPGHSREGFSDDPRLLFSVLTQFIQTDLIRQLIPGIQILTEQTDLVPPAARDTKSTVVDDNNTLHGLEIDGLALANIISRSARSNNGDESGLLYDSRPYVPGTYAAGQQRVILAGATAVDGIYEGPTQALVRTILGVLDDFEQAIDYTDGSSTQPTFDNAESLNNKRYRNKLVAMQDLLANLMGSVRDGIEHPFNTQNYLGQALRLVRDIATDTDTVVTPSGHDRTIDNILSVQVGLAQRDIIDTPTGAGDFYRSGLDVVGNFINTLIEDPTDCNTATADFDRGVNAAVTYDACVDFNPQAVFRDRGVLVERPLQPILREDLFSSLSVLLAGDAESKVIGALPFISGIIGSQLYALDNDPVSGTGPIDPTDLGNAPGCGSGAIDREFCGQEYTTGVTIADALFADIQALIPGSASVNPRIVREDDENRYDPLITDDLNRNGTIGDAALAGVFDTTFGGGAPWMSVFDDPAVAACVTNCPSTEVDNIVFDCSPPAGFPAGSLLEACTDGASGDPEVAGTPAGYTDRRFRIGFTAADGVVTLGNLNGVNAALFDGLADLIAREDYAFIVNNQVPRTSTPLQSMDQLTIRELDISTGLPVDPAFVDLLTALGDLLIDSNVGN